MPNLPKVVRDRLAGVPADVARVHPDPDLLTAFVEGAVSDRERDQVLTHLAACSDCREVAVLAAPEAVADQHLVATAPKKNWWNVSMARWAAISATAVVVLAVGLMVKSPQKQVQTSDGMGGRGDITASLDSRAALPASGNRASETREENGFADQKESAPAAAAKNSGLADQVASRDKVEAEQHANAKLRPASPPVDNFSVAENVPKSMPAAMARKAAAPAVPAQTAQPAASAQTAASQSAGAGASVSHTAPSETVEIAAGALTGNPNTIAEADADKVSSEKNKSANTQLALNKEKKDDLASSNEVASVSSSDQAKQQPARAAGVGSGSSAAMGGAFGPTQRPAAELIGTPTSIPRAKVPPVRWTIDAAGELQRSSDLGKSWQVVPVAEGTHLQALAVIEMNVWAGGAGGALYHSTDGGSSWTRVQPRDKDGALEGDINRINLADVQHVTVTTSSSMWTSADGGQTWRKQ